MRPMRTVVALGTLITVTGLVAGTPTPWMEPVQKEISPFAAQTFQVTFEGNKRACAICIGNGPQGPEQVPLELHTFLGIYVYDAHGNCVAMEDLISPAIRDDLAVEWYPPETGRYTIEVVNFGNQPNSFDLAVK